MLNNYLGVLIAAIAAYVVGWLWYGYLFKKPWTHLMGISGMSKPGKNEMTRSMIGGFIATLVMVYALAIFLNGVGVGTIGQAIQVTVIIVIGFLATILSNSIWYERKSWKLWLINVGHYLVALSVAAAVLFYW